MSEINWLFLDQGETEKKKIQDRQKATICLLECVSYLNGDFEWTIQNTNLIFRGEVIIVEEIENHQKI